MKVLYAIVDKLPFCCNECQLAWWRRDGNRMYCFCTAHKDLGDVTEYNNRRPQICPLRLKSETDKLVSDLAKAMNAINDTCDHCGWKGEFCEYSECRFFEFHKDRKEKS